MNSGPDERPQREGGQAPDGFDAIVAGWRREGGVPCWPEDGEQTVPALPPAPAPEDEHFIPPEPPPLPRLGPPAIVGLVLLGLGLILVLVPGWVGVGPAYGLPLGLFTLAAGLGWLVLRLWPDPPNPPFGPDDGAAV